MVIYNVTCKVDKSISEDWLRWLLQEHIHDIIGTGLFQDAQVLRLMETEDSEGPTYAIQYRAATLEQYQDYIEKYSHEMRKKAVEKWGDKFIAFRSLLEVVH